MNQAEISSALRTLERASKNWSVPYVDADAARHRNPFRVLVACLLSLRTKDAATEAASKRLFRRARSPRGLLRLSEEQISELIYPVGFYRTKASTLHKIIRALLQNHDGNVPDSMEALLALPGVGRKTANLVLTRGFGKAGICVDIHVHRIVNRWGYVQTDNPDKTELTLREKLPRRYWIRLNGLLVAFGQSVCTPVSPWCSQCPIAEACDQLGVARSR